MNAYEKLKEDIVDIVHDDVPVDLVCPHCERNIDYESIVLSDSRQWNTMAERVVEVTIDSIPDIIKEVLNK